MVSNKPHFLGNNFFTDIILLVNPTFLKPIHIRFSIKIILWLVQRMFWEQDKKAQKNANIYYPSHKFSFYNILKHLFMTLAIFFLCVFERVSGFDQ